MGELPEVLLYSRRQCGLCDRARETIERVRAAIPFSFEEVLIDGEDVLEREYGLRVPVVLVDGREAFEAELTAKQLVEELAPGA